MCTDNTISAYVPTSGDLAAVHQPLLIDGFATAKFNELLLGVMKGAGVNNTDLAAVAGILYSDPVRFAVCKTGDPSCTTFCANFTLPGITSGSALMTSVVNGSITAALGVPFLKRYFDGTKPAGSTNFLTDTVAFTGLFNHLVEFFGFALGCNDGSIPAYSGSNMKVAHMGMGINTTEFNAFRDAVAGVAGAAGVPMAGQNFIKMVIDTTRLDIVEVNDTVSTTTSGSATTSATSTTSGTTSATSTTSGTTSATSTTATTSTSSTTSTTDTGTGFGMILVAPLLSLVSMLLF
jgi:hypothetical protein